MPFFTPEDLSAWTGGAWTAMPPAVRRVVHDSREAREGDLYVALRGERCDGHTFIPEAFARGAAAALVDADFAAGHSSEGPLLGVADTKTALTSIARGHRARLEGELLAVTGSVGKSTVKEMLAAVLAEHGPTARNRGNWNNDIGVPLSLLGMEPTDRFGVFEVGMNHPGELAPLCALLRPAWGIMTRIAPVHTEFFANEAAIADEKATLFRALPPGGVAVAASDEPWFDRVSAAAGCRLVTVAFSGPADYVGARHPSAPGVLRVTERDGAAYDYPLSLPGEPIRRNALRVIAVGREHGFEPDRIARGLAKFAPLPMRWEDRMLDGVRWINDAYNASPVSLQAAIDTFAEVQTTGGRWLVLGGMRELDAQSREAHEAIGRSLASGAWAGLIVKGPLAAGIADGAGAAGFPRERIRRCATAAEAAQALHAYVDPGDAVLLKGSRGEHVEDVLSEWARLRKLTI